MGHMDKYGCCWVRLLGTRSAPEKTPQLPQGAVHRCSSKQTCADYLPGLPWAEGPFGMVREGPLPLNKTQSDLKTRSSCISILYSNKNTAAPECLLGLRRFLCMMLFDFHKHHIRKVELAPFYGRENRGSEG